MRIVVNTPAGNIGRIVTEMLLQANEEVVIISRNPQKVSELVQSGAHLVEGSIDDPDVLHNAFKGADCLFWVTPPAYMRPDFKNWVIQTAQIAADTAKSNGIQHVVLVSSGGAQFGDGAGPIGILFHVENAFKNAVPHVTVLRAGFFMENFLNNVDTIIHNKAIYGTLKANKKFPIVATYDIACKATAILRDRHWNGFRILGVHGPEDLNQIQAAQIISEGINFPVTYVEITVDQLKQQMLHSGMPDYIVDLVTEMYIAVDEGRTEIAEPRSMETTTPTSLLDFSRNILKPVVEKAMSKSYQTTH